MTETRKEREHQSLLHVYNLHSVLRSSIAIARQLIKIDAHSAAYINIYYTLHYSCCSLPFTEVSVYCYDIGVKHLKKNAQHGWGMVGSALRTAMLGLQEQKEENGWRSLTCSWKKLENQEAAVGGPSPATTPGRLEEEEEEEENGWFDMRLEEAEEPGGCHGRGECIAGNNTRATGGGGGG